MKALLVLARKVRRAIPVALTGLVAATCSSARAADGYATVNGDTTGGQAGPTVTVSNEVDFASYAKTNVPYVVQIVGTITTNISAGLSLAADKTIIGLGTNATFIGRLKLSGPTVSNIVFRNLFISDPFGSDGITIDNGAHHVWVDHCTFYDCSDGEVDVTEQADYVTVSWCKFFYITQGSHRFVNLVGSDDALTNDLGTLHVTFHHNWWGPLCQERMPRVRFGLNHVYDNYYDCSNNNYCVGVGTDCQILLENNSFDHVTNIWKNYSSSDQQGLIHWNDGNVFTNGTTVPTWASNSTVFTPPYDYTLDSATGLAVVVTNNAGAGHLPLAAFTASPTNGSPPLTVMFTDASTGFEPLSLFWDLGDGATTNTESSASFTHTYATADTYTVTLVASNLAGASLTASNNPITVFTPSQAWQMHYFGCIDCPQAADTADPDGDGQNNLAEFLAGTDPTSALSSLRIVSATKTGDDVLITWTTAGGRTNAVQASSGDETGGYTTNFLDITTPPHIIIPGNGDATNHYLDEGGATNTPSRFYRIRLVP
ncbi:MAG TPA: PKD domain-containing protein [Verrucomicrobiae bacterium]|nr:PKD domain-containing protein [Verrucomicrobiae bacterium]